MMDGISFDFIICILCFPSLVVGTVTISFDPVKPPLADSVDIKCTLTGSSSTAVTWNFGSTTTSCGSGLCSPDPSPHTYSMSGNVYTLTLPSPAIANCISYRCADAGNNADAVSEDLFVAYFDKTDIVPTEPGANTNGTIGVTTGCVLSASDLTIVWYKIENGEEIEITADINTSDRSTCTRTCHTQEDEKVTSGFNHTEYTGQDSIAVQYKVNISHKSYPDAAFRYTWTSDSYMIKKTASTTTTSSTITTSTTTTLPTTTAATMPTTKTTTRPIATTRIMPISTTTRPTTTRTTLPTTITATTPISTTTTRPTTTTTLVMPDTTAPMIRPTTAKMPSSTSKTSDNGLSNEIIIVIVVVPVGVLTVIGIVIFFCIFYRLQGLKREPVNHKRHKKEKYYKGNMRRVQQQHPYILYGIYHGGKSDQKETKRSRSLHNDDRYNLYHGDLHGSRVKQNPVYKGDKNHSRLYYNESLPRNDDYRSEYTTGHVYLSHASRYQYRPDYHGDSRRHRNCQHYSYPIYSRQQEYIYPSYSFMGY